MIRLDHKPLHFVYPHRNRSEDPDLFVLHSYFRGRVRFLSLASYDVYTGQERHNSLIYAVNTVHRRVYMCRWCVCVCLFVCMYLSISFGPQGASILIFIRRTHHTCPCTCAQHGFEGGAAPPIDDPLRRIGSLAWNERGRHLYVGKRWLAHMNTVPDGRVVSMYACPCISFAFPYFPIQAGPIPDT